jgi:peptidoglycan/LPS O-acetylase OafA/YrhL
VKNTAARFASLDGLRAVSILLVVVSHLYASPVAYSLTRHLDRWDIGNLGVRVFFVISGFLITSLLLDEKAKTGHISLRGFYIRRFFRIAPVYYLYLLVVALLVPFGFANASPQDLTAAFLYLSNYWSPHWSVGHTWSLAVEEQFYLLWPCALVFLGNRRSRNCALAFLLVVPILRTTELVLHWDKANRTFEAVADALATGCLLALCREQLWSIDIYRRVLQSRWFWVLPVVLFVVLARSPKLIWNAAVGLAVLNIGIAMVLDRYMRIPDGPVGRFLNARPIVWIGTLSYSIYLWHILFILNEGMPHQWVFPLNVVCALLAAIASYYLVERPFLSLRTRLFAAPQRKSASLLS